MFITKKHLDRRTFLRGAGVSLALPFLDAMAPAQTPIAKTAANPAMRSGFIYVPHGVILDRWTPIGDGADFEFQAINKPLEPLREHVVMVTNLQNTFGSGHALATATYLSNTAPKQTESEDVRMSATVDQTIASAVGQDTPFPSLELATEDFSGLVGACDPDYSCIYMNTISWQTPTTPLPMEINPRVLFERMFGDGSTAEARAQRLKDNGSILDSIQADVNHLEYGLGPADRVKLSEYTENVREIERRIQNASSQSLENLETPDAPIGAPDSYKDHVNLMYDLMALAYQADLTRVISFMVARDLSQKTYPWIGVSEAHHAASHHQNDPGKIEAHAKINTYHVEILARFLDKLRNTPDGDGTLLDHSLILWGSGMGNGNVHAHDPLPIVVAGGANGQVKGNRHIKLPEHTPMGNLLTSLAQKAGVDIDRFGSSDGVVDL